MCLPHNYQVAWLRCDVMSNRLCRPQQIANTASETQSRCVKIVILSSCMGPLCHVRNIIMYVLSWWSVYVLTECYFGVYFPICEATSEINIKIRLEWVHKWLRHSSTYINPCIQSSYISLFEQHHYILLLNHLARDPAGHLNICRLTKTYSKSLIVIAKTSSQLAWTHIVVNTVPADGPAPLVARAYASQVQCPNTYRLGTENINLRC